MRPHLAASSSLRPTEAAPAPRLRLVVVGLVVALVATLSPAAAAVAHEDGATSVAPRPRTEAELTAERIVQRILAEARVDPQRHAPGTSERPAPPLTGWTDVREVARAWSDQMAAAGTLRHNPSYSSQICCWSAVAENVAFVGGLGSQHTVTSAAEMLVRSLLDSPSHRRSMLSATYDEVGVGVSVRGDRMYGTVNLRARRAGTTPPGSVYVLPASLDPTIRRACPAATSLPMPFRDVTGGPHAQPIACALAWGVVSGRTPTTYEPARAVTRAQVATMLRRLLEASGASFDAAPVRFRDVAGGPHAESIGLLAGAGIVQGLGDGRFGPDEPVRRDQMASLLIRGLERAHGVVPPQGPAFPDVTSGPHTTAIRRLVGAGITRGDADGRYDPRGTVRRDQMATFAARTADLLVRGGHTAAPTRAGG